MDEMDGKLPYFVTSSTQQNMFNFKIFIRIFLLVTRIQPHVYRLQWEQVSLQPQLKRHNTTYQWECQQVSDQ